MKRNLTLIAILLIAAFFATQAFGDNLGALRRTGAPVGKGDPTIGTGLPRLTGGPDGFGYTFTDSTEPGGPTFNFIDISGTGTPIALGDDAELQVPVGFSFPFYGNNFTDVFVVSNGFLDFNGGNAGAFTNDCPLDGTSPMDIIAPYWDDLDPGDDGALAFHETFGACPQTAGGAGACLIVQWEEFDFFPGDGVPGGTAGTFQAILYDTGSMLYQYDTATLDGASATIAINQDGAANSLTYSCDSPTTGAGLAILYETGLVGDLEIVKTAPDGVAIPATGPYNYQLDVQNLGPDDQTGVVVTDVLDANLDYVGDDCGGSFDMGTNTFTWNIGDLANGAMASCLLTVQLTTPDCATVVNTATVTGDEADPPGNSSSTTTNGGGNEVADPGFEGGTPNGTWTETSTNFGTPICDVGTCGTGGGTGPFAGLFWAWFGGIGGVLEDGTVSQSVVIPVGSTTLTFWLEAPVCTADPMDFMEVTIDGNQVFMIDTTSPLCNVVGYTQQMVDISAFADGAAHTLEFHSTTFGSGTTNFFVDDVEILGAPMCTDSVISGGFDPTVPTLNQYGLLALLLALGTAGVFFLRRR